MPELLELAVGQIEPGTEIVLVSTRPLDLPIPPTRADCRGKWCDGLAVAECGWWTLRAQDLEKCFLS